MEIGLANSLANIMKIDRRRKPYSNPSSFSYSSKASLIMAFISCLAWLYVAGRLWQDAENRAILFNLLQKNSRHIPKVVSVQDKLKDLGCKEIRRKIVEAEMDLTLAKSRGYLSHNGSSSDKRLLAVVGVYTGFGSRLRRKMFRATWMPRGDALKKLEDSGVVLRFVIGRSPNRGDSLDRNIDNENGETQDFLILDSHEEASEEFSKKAKYFFSTAVERWDADFYVKVDDGINIDIDGLIGILKSHHDRHNAYMGCMKSGAVVSEDIKGTKGHCCCCWSKLFVLQQLASSGGESNCLSSSNFSILVKVSLSGPCFFSSIISGRVSTKSVCCSLFFVILWLYLKFFFLKCCRRNDYSQHYLYHWFV